VVARSEALESVESEVRALTRRIKRVIAERAAEVHPELQPASFLILGWLAENGPARGTSLACEFNIDKGAISRQVQHLVDLGLVERSADPEDGRAVLVQTTAAARALLDSAQEERRRSWEDKLQAWSIDELESFARQLARFTHDLD
jgi:DNA-binding MarR family transcriptional regulator